MTTGRFFSNSDKASGMTALTASAVVLVPRVMVKVLVVLLPTVVDCCSSFKTEGTGVGAGGGATGSLLVGGAVGFGACFTVTGGDRMNPLPGIVLLKGSLKQSGSSAFVTVTVITMALSLASAEGVPVLP